MFRGFRWIALAGVVAVAALVGPSVALADCSGSSAVSIYSECQQNANGKPHSTGSKQPTSQPTGNTQPTYTWHPPAHVSQTTKNALNHAGHAKTSLGRIIENSNPDIAAPLKVVQAAAPTALGSQFDLGAGPMFLLALLLGTVLVLLGTGGARAWRNRHRA